MNRVIKNIGLLTIKLFTIQSFIIYILLHIYKSPNNNSRCMRHYMHHTGLIKIKLNEINLI